jgi:hypothetical protein
MNEVATAIPKAKVVFIEHPVKLFPAFNGDRTQSDKRFGSHKFVLSLPIPSTDAEASEFYGKSIKELITMGTIQNMYGESTFKTTCGDLTGQALIDHVKAEVGDFAVDAGHIKVREYFEGLCKRERVTRAKVVKSPEALLAAKLGVDIAEVEKMIAKMKKA